MRRRKTSEKTRLVGGSIYDPEPETNYLLASCLLLVAVGLVSTYTLFAGIFTFIGVANIYPGDYALGRVPVPISYNYSYVNSTKVLQVPLEKVKLSGFNFEDSHFIATRSGWYSFFGDVNYDLNTEPFGVIRLRDVVRLQVTINGKVQNNGNDAFLYYFNDTDYYTEFARDSGTLHDLIYLDGGDNITLQIAPLTRFYYLGNLTTDYDYAVLEFTFPDRIFLNITEGSFGVYSIDR